MCEFAGLFMGKMKIEQMKDKKLKYKIDEYHKAMRQEEQLENDNENNQQQHSYGMGCNKEFVRFLTTLIDF